MSRTSLGGQKDRPWYPRFWDGMNVSAWWRLLRRHRFAVSPVRVPMAGIISGCAALNSALAATQSLFLEGKIDGTKIEQEPIFIIGHWRSGTTMLQEYLSLDSRHTYPDTYACFAPNHFLMTRHFLRPMLSFMMPSRRPMDNMAAGWDRPQEDEFALCNMGLPSPYLWIAFPNHPEQIYEFLDLEDEPAEVISEWRQKLLWFLKCVTLCESKRIILKSPPHTARIKVLLELFPDARFIHIHRDPYVIFPSTVNLWKRLSKDHGLQRPNNKHLDEQIFRNFERMYQAFERDRHLIDPSRFCELSYESLVANPLEQLGAIYDQLELGGFDEVRPALQTRIDGQSDYKTNRYEISEQTRGEITRRWSSYIEKYGYSSETTTV